jgi:hypothetical protein
MNFSKKFLFFSMSIGLSLTLMSFENNQSSNYGSSIEVSNSNNVTASSDDLAITGLLRTAVNAGRWAIQHTARTCPQWEHAMVNATTLMIVSNENQQQIASLQETKNAKLLALN